MLQHCTVPKPRAVKLGLQVTNVLHLQLWSDVSIYGMNMVIGVVSDITIPQLSSVFPQNLMMSRIY